jgi:opacity protein-like surface antigen
MRKAILGAAGALALASPAVAADLSVTPRYSEGPSVSETVVVRRPVIVAPPPVVVDEYPVYAGATDIISAAGGRASDM